MNFEDVQTLTREEAQAELDDLLKVPPQDAWDSHEAMLWRARKALLELWIISNQSPTKKEPMSWILTASGRHFDYQNPTPDMIDLGDIAKALSREARFNGHTHDFYSVAQHSVLVSRVVPQDFALEALLHDATEAYLKDLPAPLKTLLPDYKAIEHRVDIAIRTRFGLPLEPSDMVKHADRVLLATERRDQMPADETPWELLRDVRALTHVIHGLAPRQAEFFFLDRAWGLLDPEGRDEE